MDVEQIVRIALAHNYTERWMLSPEGIAEKREELRRRDEFFAWLDKKFPIRMEGEDIVMDIPDIDVMGMMEITNYA